MEDMQKALKMKEMLYSELKKLYTPSLKSIAEKYPDFPDIDKIDSFTELKNVSKEVQKALKNQNKELRKEIMKIVKKEKEVMNTVLVNSLFAMGYAKDEVYKTLDEMESERILRKSGVEWIKAIWTLN